MKDSISTSLKHELHQLSLDIHNNPELGFEEHYAAKRHMDLLAKHEFNVQSNFLDCKTAFVAEFSVSSGPTVAFMTEYDALPDLGHACGHNLIGMVSTGAAIALSKKMKNDRIPGRIIVFGTPAEETSGFKAILAESIALETVDICLMAHPGDDHYRSGTSLALDALEFDFIGKSAHAASSPEQGINALDAVINTFNSINALRQQTTPDSRIHGVISKGGTAPNVIPDYAQCRFYIRSSKRSTLSPLTEKVINCASAGALAAGAQIKHRYYEASYDELITNSVLSELYCREGINQGIDFSPIPRTSYGSLDIGNISHVVPSIHPYFKAAEKGTAAHTKEFEQAVCTDGAHLEAFKVLNTFVEISLQYLQDERIRIAIKDEFLRESVRRT